MSRRQRDKVATLTRRQVFLQHRILTYTEPEKAHRDRAEEAALRWVLALVHAADHQGILDDLEGLA